MQILNQNLNKTISKNFSFLFNVAESGIYLIEIIASCKNWRQNWAHLFNDDDLAVKIDNTEFPKLNKKNGLLNGEEVEILEKEAEGEYIENLSDIWHKIKYDGQEGYVLSSFIEISGQERNVKETKKAEAENYTKSILKNFYNKEWGKKLFFPILILTILAVVQLFGLNKINRIAYNASIINAFDENNQEKNIIELYNIENDTSGNNIIDEIFNLKLGNEEKILRIKGSRELIGNDIDKKVSIFLNGKELLNKQEGLKDLLLWNSNILIARFWGGQSVYNYIFDLKNGGAIIPFVGDGESHNFSSSVGGSWIGEIPVFGEVFFLYYEGGELCDGAGEIYRLYGDLDGLRMIKLWDMKQSNDWCDNFKG